MAKIIGGRLYNLGNDYPGDIGCRPVPEGTWVASSYLDGIYTEAEDGYISGGWNKYFNTILPEEEWTSAESGKVFPDEYAVAYVAKEADHVSAVKEYASEGVEAVAAEGVIDPEAAATPTPYYKKPLSEMDFFNK